MKVITTVSISHPSLDVSTLLLTLPRAFDSVRSALSAGVAETGPDGMTIDVAGANALARVHFKITYEAPTGTLADLADEAADVSG